MDIIKSNLSYHISINTTPIRHFSCVYLHVQRGGVIFQEMLHIIEIDAIIVHDMKINEYSVHFSVYFQRVTPSGKVEIVSTLYFNTAKKKNVSRQNRLDTDSPSFHKANTSR